MKSYSVTSARGKMPALLDEVITKHEIIIISRKGKPVAQIVPIPSITYSAETTRFPLRGVAISFAEDFDEPAPELWEALE